jgi:hypothetical protein
MYHILYVKNKAPQYMKRQSSPLCQFPNEKQTLVRESGFKILGCTFGYGFDKSPNFWVNVSEQKSS